MPRAVPFPSVILLGAPISVTVYFVALQPVVAVVGVLPTNQVKPPEVLVPAKGYVKVPAPPLPVRVMEPFFIYALVPPLLKVLVVPA